MRCDAARDSLHWTVLDDGDDCVTEAAMWGACVAGSCRDATQTDPEVCDDDDEDACADTWVVVDALGRRLPDASVVGPTRPDRTVGMFYWTWHEASRGGPYDITRILAENPDAPEWGPIAAPHHWGEPELGYYSSEDAYVYRRHASMLADAGVDVLIMDTSNSPFTWPEHTRILCEVLADMRASGDAVPQIAFLAPFWEPAEVVHRLYDDLYAPGTCRESWFMWDGKPLIMADPELVREHDCDSCTGGVGCDAACQGIGHAAGRCEVPGSTDPGACCSCQDDVAPITDFFTFRKPMPSYFDGPSGPNQWGWLENAPQHVFRGSTGSREEMTVGVAQNATDHDLAPMSLQTGIHGRTWHDGHRETSPDAVRRGANFQEQWDWVHTMGPRFVFVTGWNEWVAGRFEQWQGVGGGAVFPDQFSQEYSRDIEPMAGGHGDDYYYQLAANVRRFKGARRLQRPSPPRTIAIDGDFDSWAAVLPKYRDTTGDTMHRDAAGYGGLRYTESSGRNDLVESRVTWDDEHVFFYVRTAAALSPWSDPHWMVLLIDSDDDRSTGWQGYELAINDPATSATSTSVTRLSDHTVLGSATMAVAGAELEIAVPRTLLDQDGEVAFTFHWADNTVTGDAPAAFGALGDNAPNRRASYSFVPW